MKPSDPVIEAYKAHVDRSSIRESLQRSVEEPAGRPRDFEAIAELEAIREERERGSGPGPTLR
jgi:hypothetical protein